MLNEELMDRVLDPDNLRASFVAVKANRGSAGVDGIGTEELGEHLRAHWKGIEAKLRAGSYKPAPVRAVRIPKAGGGERQLGIPTTLDRLIQQALKGVLEPIFDPDFSDHSYGFRPGRSAHDAVRAARDLVVNENRRWVIDIDIEAFFDHVDHDILMREVARKVRDPRVLKLLGRYLRAPLKDGAESHQRKKGTPQGGPLSPLLANIYLDQLDAELERRGVKFIRYADDLTIYCGSPRSAERSYASIVQWIERHLKLKVNRLKSGTRPPEEGSFLGFRIAPDGRIRISDKSLKRLKVRVRELWDARQSKTSEQLRDQWVSYIRGWWSYFRLTECSWDYSGPSKWMRRHIRKCFWQRWHNHRGRRNALTRLGLPPHLVRLGSCSRGAWRMAAHVVMQRALSNKLLRAHGFVTPSDLAQVQS